MCRQPGREVRGRPWTDFLFASCSDTLMENLSLGTARLIGKRLRLCVSSQRIH